MDANSLGILAISVDWEFIKEVTELTLSFITTGAVVVAAWIGSKGIDSWRKESVGKRRIELCEEVLELFYQSKDSIMHMRSPLSFGGEGSTRKAEENETKKEKEARDRAYILFERYDAHKELFSKIHSLRYRFMAQIGPDEIKPFEDLRQVINDLFMAARMLSELWSITKQWIGPDEKQKHFEDIKKYEQIFWWYGKQDPIVPRIDKIISDIENICNKVITGKKSNN